jgi:hypothetical protein
VRSGGILLAALLAIAVVAVVLYDGPRRAAAGQGVLYTWVEIGPAGRAFARAITVAPQCPAISIDGVSRPMASRAAPDQAFPVAVCEARVEGAVQAAIEGIDLPLPRPDPRRIVVIGDTGCRMQQTQTSGHFQNCSDPAAWPFAAIAARAAAWQPDLIVHVGDYVYREAPCPAGNAGCTGSPWGDIWATWDIDFFGPAAPLLRAAPLVVVRGNHEACSRQGSGWFRLLDPRPFTGECTDYSAPYAVPLGDHQLLLLDSAAADDYVLQPAQVDQYRRDLTALVEAAALNQRARDSAWLLTHDPLWVFGHAGVENGTEQLFTDNANLQAAARGLLPEGLQLVLSGHIHLFEALDFGGPRPGQLVVGMSGTALDPPLTTPLTGLAIDGITVAQGSVLTQQFGYVTMERDGDGWQTAVRDVSGGVIRTCRAEHRRLLCAE